MKNSAAKKRLQERINSYENALAGRGFSNRSQPKGLGNNGYKRPGSNKKT